MRISVDCRDPDYAPQFMGARVFLNDALCDRVIAVDVVRGEVLRFATDEHGRVIVDEGIPRRETVRGQVRLEMR